jgi:hypothetical protein
MIEDEESLESKIAKLNKAAELNLKEETNKNMIQAK